MSPLLFKCTLGYNLIANVCSNDVVSSCRLWFPCVDCYQEVCNWTIDVTTPSNMTAVSCGELYEQVMEYRDGERFAELLLWIPSNEVFHKKTRMLPYV